MNVADTNEKRSRCKVLLTRSEDDCAQWAAELAQRGIDSVSLPCISTEAIDTAQLRAELRDALPTAQWIIVTSRRGVDALARIGTGRDASANHDDELAAAPESGNRSKFNYPKVAAVGNVTARRAHELLGRVDLIGAGTAEDLAKRFIKQVAPPASVLIVVAENAGTTLERELASAGFDCQRFNVYRTIPAAPRKSKHTLASCEVDAVLLASPSAVIGLTNQIAVDTNTVLITIGPSTSRAVRDHGLHVTAEADETRLESLVTALSRVLPLSKYDSHPTFTETLHV